MLFRSAATEAGPVYIRLGRQVVPHVTPLGYKFEKGRAHVFGPGGDVTIIACGVMVAEALKAAEELRQGGLSVQVVNMGSIKPLDTGVLDAAASQSRLIVTVEEHFTAGGLGSACVDYLSSLSSRPLVRILGVEDQFGQSGDPDELLDLYGLRACNIVAAVKKTLDT